MEWEHGRNLIKSVTTATTSQVVSENKIDIENEMVYTYDAEGIRTGRTYTTRIYRYAKNNGDSSIASVGETAANETYSRYLVSRSEVEHQYVTQNGKVVRETVISGGVTRVLDYIYDESGRPSSVIFKDGTADKVTYYYVLNLQGDVEKIIDANGEIQAQYTYDPWGKILSITDDDGASVGNTHIGKLNSLRYRGYYYDRETGWYYLQSRYYDPVLHRFINADSFASTGQGIIGTNMFAYCGNNPINQKDPSGQGWITALIITAVVVVVSAVVAKSVADNKIDKSGANDAEKALAKKDYIAAYQVNQAKTITEDYIDKTYGRENDFDGTQVNAYRHAMWNAVMTDKIGEKRRKNLRMHTNSSLIIQLNIWKWIFIIMSWVEE